MIEQQIREIVQTLIFIYSSGPETSEWANTNDISGHMTIAMKLFVHIIIVKTRNPASRVSKRACLVAMNSESRKDK